MLKILKKMRTVLLFGLFVAPVLLTANAALADTITLVDSLSGLVYYDGEYCGAIGATLNGTTDSISGGITCVDISKNSYIGSTIGVTVSTLSLSGISGARFGSDAAALLKYEEAAWLSTQIASHPDQAGEIQFAIWRLFDPTYQFQSGSDRNITLEDYWLAQALAIDPSNYDFSSIRIYTPTGAYASNQEFISGSVTILNYSSNPVPIPGSALLLGSGILALAIPRLKRRKVIAGEGDLEG